VRPTPGPAPTATAEESERILRWLESEGVRLIAVEGEWCCPVTGSGRHVHLHDAADGSRVSLVPFDERRELTPVHQPAR
jgi:DNA polymerase-3 subunit epsilon